MSMALLPETFMAFSVSLPRPISSTTFEGSAAPITGISLASHCWKGLGEKYPSDVNQRVNGARMVIVCGRVVPGSVNVAVTVTYL